MVEAGACCYSGPGLVVMGVRVYSVPLLCWVPSHQMSQAKALMSWTPLASQLKQENVERPL